MGEYGFSKDLDLDELAVVNTQGIVFEECQYKEMDANDFITKFMQSRVAAELDSMESGVFSAGASQLNRYALELIGPVKKLNNKNRAFDDQLYWVGYIYRYWAYLLGTPSNEIIKITPAKRALQCYPAFHCMGNKEAIAQMISIAKE